MMGYIKRKKPGIFPAWAGSNAYEYIEVDEFGNPIVQPDIVQNVQPSRQDFNQKPPILTEPKIAPGIRAPDKIKGFSRPFDYHQWNALRKKSRVGKKK